MNKKLWLCAALGVLVGAACVQIAHVMSDRNSRELFGEHLRCKTLADKYVKEHVNPYYIVVVDHVEFSRSRSSCLVSTHEQFGPIQKSSSDWTYKVVDLLSDENIAVLPCSGDGECAKSMQERDAAFEKVR